MSAPLRGEIQVPGDKSVGHRACLFAALGDGVSHVRGLGKGEDLGSTRRALGALGVNFEPFIDSDTGAPAFRVQGVGLRGLRAPTGPIDCGNSGTTIRLLCGVLAGQGFDAILDGDESLRQRPMNRVVRVLTPLGAHIELPEGDRPPLTIRGRALVGTSVRTGLASAQVKSAVLLAGLLAEGETTVEETGPSRDHTERMLGGLGVDVRSEGHTVWLRPPVGLPAQDWTLPGDPSSAAFWLAAAALVPGSDLTVTGVSLNPTRTGFIDILRTMGVAVDVEETSRLANEPVGRVRVRGGALRGAVIEGDVIPRAIDELPLVAVLASLAQGETRVVGAGELKVKESDRLAAMSEGLRAMGARLELTTDGWAIEGVSRLSGAAVRTFGDHRVAMALRIAGLMADGPVQLDDPSCVAVSYPGFLERLDEAIKGSVF